MNNLSSKSEKEAFVSGLKGTSLFEVTVITNISLILAAVRALFLAISPGIFIRNLWIRFLFEWTIMIFPLVAVTTVLSDDSSAIFFSTIIFTVLTILMLPSKKEQPVESTNVNYLLQPSTEELINNDVEISDDSDIENEEIKKKEFSFIERPILAPNRVPIITTFRAYTTIISCICILAVDFTAFPRRLAKTEVYGSGLMDTGVGLFVVSNAIVSPEARGKQVRIRTLLEKFNHTRAAFLSSWPLWLIGLIRVVSVKLIGYQEHVSEYGVHWNFFFTLAAVKILSAFLFSFFSTKFCIPLTVVLIGVYQTLLSHPRTDMTQLILNTDREGFFMANKEGLSSCLGYLAIYLGSVQLGVFLLQGQRTTVKSWLSALYQLTVVDVMLWTATLIASSYVQPISRRFANLAFVLWTLSLCIEFFIVLLLVDLFLIICIGREHKLPPYCKPDQWMMKKKKQEVKMTYNPLPPPTCILHAVNRNQFAYFMISNLATGLVNHTVDTLQASTADAVLIISLYMFSTLLLIWILHVKEINLKFW